MELTKEQANFCKSMIFLFWWEKPEDLLKNPERILAGVMDRGGVKEWALMEKIFPSQFLVRVLDTAVCGEFHKWSWLFWRGRLKLDDTVPLPPRMPGIPSPDGELWYRNLQNKTPQIDWDNPPQRLAWTKRLRNREK